MIYVRNITESSPVGEARTISIDFVINSRGDGARIYRALREVADAHPEHWDVDVVPHVKGSWE